MSDQDQAPGTAQPTSPAEAKSTNVSVPEGYTLIPTDMYNRLMDKELPTAQGAKETEIPIYITMLKPLHFGDIKAQVSPDETITVVFSSYIKIRGRKFNELGSFMNIWNKTYPKSQRYDPKHPKYFEVENPEDLEKALGQHSHRRRKQPTPALSEEQRIQSEEASRSRTPTQENAAADGIEMDGLPPRGSQARKDLIASRPVERVSAGKTAAAAIETDENMGVEDFTTSVTTDDQRVVATIDGPTAEAVELAPIQAARAARTKSKAVRR